MSEKHQKHQLGLVLSWCTLVHHLNSDGPVQAGPARETVLTEDEVLAETVGCGASSRNAFQGAGLKVTIRLEWAGIRSMVEECWAL